MNSTFEIIEDIRLGRMVILVDDEERENEGDLIFAADFVTPEKINFMAKEARGLICLSLTEDQIDRLNIPLMVGEQSNYSPNQTAFTVSIEASSGVSTGISAQDRCYTIQVAAAPGAKPQDIIMPGHIFPIKAKKGGVLQRAGHTEASVDLCRLAGVNQAAVICEIMNSDGSMARVPDLKAFALQHQLKMGTIEDLIRYRMESESLIELSYEQSLIHPLLGKVLLRVYQDQIHGREFLALIKGNPDAFQSQIVPVRVHSENLLVDSFGFESQTDTVLKNVIHEINKINCGVILFLRNKESSLIRSIGSKSSSVPKEQKDYGFGAQVLKSIGLSKINLITSNPLKRVGLKGFGIEVVSTLDLRI